MRAVVLALMVAGFVAVAAAPADDFVVPRYHRGMWLLDSLATVDVIVLGTPRPPPGANADPDTRTPPAREVKQLPATLHVAKTLFGALNADLCLGDDVVKLVRPYRCTWEEKGLWLLLRTPQGYFVMNPEADPLPSAEWTVLAKLLAARPKPRPALKEQSATHQLHHYYVNDKKEHVWHGVNVWVGLASVSMELYEDGRRTLIRAWDEQGRLEAIHRDGLSLRFLNGRVWEFSRSEAGRKSGVSGSYFQEKLDQPREQSHWHNGLRHGPTRQWDRSGKLMSEVVYENGFLPPVVRYRGKETSRAKLHQTEDNNSYEADRELMDALKVGLTIAEVSELLKLDFSEADGIHFPRYEERTALHISFEKGRIAERHIQRRPSFDLKMK